MKKAVFFRLCIFLSACFVFLTVGSMFSCADMMWAPDMDTFYVEHSKDCVNIDKTYIANGANGYITAWKSPNSLSKYSYYKNGTKFCVRSVYTDSNGNKWGLVNPSPDKEISFWIPIKDFTTGDDGAAIVPPALYLPVLFPNFSFALLMILVVFAVAVTAAIIRSSWKKKKSSDD